jgi:hypothetical protein
MATCPNKNLPEWKELVSSKGEDMAYYLWNRYNGAPPANVVNFELKAFKLLASKKAEEVFAKGEKNNWDLNKILTELQIPKEQKKIILDKGIINRDEIVSSILAENTYSIEVNTMRSLETGEPMQSYSNLTVPGGTNYTVNEIATPAIVPIHRGHAAFATDNGIGWFRSDEQVLNGKIIGNEATGDAFGGWYPSTQKTVEGTKTKTRRILEVQSDLFQKNKKAVQIVEEEVVNEITENTRIKLISKGFETGQKFKVKDTWFQVIRVTNKGEQRYYHIANMLSQQTVILSQKKLEAAIKKHNNLTDGSKNAFLQILNKGTNWINFFVQSIAQDSFKKGYKKLLFPTGPTVAKVEGHSVVADKIKQLEEYIELGKNPKKRDEKITVLQEQINKISLQHVDKFEFQEPQTLVEGFDYSRVQHTDSPIRQGDHVNKLPQGYKGYYIFSYNTRADALNRDKITPISKEKAYEIWKQDGSDLPIEARREVYELRDEIFKIESTVRRLETNEQELKRYQTEGLEKIAPIEYFYSNTVTNILKKLYNIKEVTDEHGNTWNEVDLENEKTNTAILLQIKGTESTPADSATLNKMKEAAKKMGIKFNTLEAYAKAHPEIDLSNANALADLFRGVVAVAEGKEDVALTEEIVHIASAILYETNPNLITSLLKQINKYKIYQDTLAQYRDNKEYQLSNGKPDIRKIKKEALDKLIVEVIVKGNQDLAKFPELAYADNLNWVQRAWESIKQAIRSLYKQSDIDILGRVAAKVSLGDVEGTVSDLNSNEIFLQVEENEGVNNFVDLLLQMDKDIEGPFDEVKDAKGNVITPRHYIYKGQKITTVTTKLNKNKDFKDLPDNEDKMVWGTRGHKYVEEYIRTNLIDKNGYKKPKTNARINSELNVATTSALQSFAQELIDSYPPGTRFLTEVKAANTDIKGGLGGTIDFMAVIPQPNNDFKVDILDWKFTSFNKNKYTDLSPGKQKAWKMQMGEYVRMLRSSGYKVPAKNIRRARMVPFITGYSYAIPNIPESGLVLNDLEIGAVDPTKENRLYLLPVATDEESTGNIKIDALVNGLQKQQTKMYKKFRSPKERSQKDAEMKAIQAAIKKLRVQLDFDPLYSVGRDLNKRIEKVLRDYQTLDFDKLSKGEINSKLEELIEFQDSLEKFINLREIYNSFLSKDDDKLTEEERSSLAKISSISNRAEDLNNRIIDIQNNFVKEVAVKLGEIKEENKDDILKPEVAVDKLSSSFMEGSRLSPRIIRIASNMILKAASLVNINIDQKIRKYGELVNDLERQASAMGVKAFSLIGEVKENDLQLINKIDSQYYKDQRKAIENNDVAFFKRNMDLNSYRKMIHDLKKERYAIIDETIYTSDVNENNERRKFAKESFKNKIDIFSRDFNSLNDSYFLYIYKQNFIEENHYSKEFKNLKKNEAAYKVWEFFMDLNAQARDLGYLERQKQSFFPLIEATSLQKIGQTSNYTSQGLDFFKDVYMSRINESMDYNSVDPETGEVKKVIPKYFTQTDKKVEQLSLDLNLVGSLWIKSVEEYKNAKELEHVLHTMHIVEKSKGGIVQEGGKTVYNGSNIVTKEDNPNARLLQTIVDDYIYNKREDSASPGNKVIDLGVSKVTSEENQEKVGLDTRKALNSANDLVRLLALGAKVPLGVANWVGTQMQSFIKSGIMYLYKDYQLAHGKVTFSDIGAMNIKEKALIDFFVPLNDDTALEARRKVAKEKGLIKYLSTWSFTDVMMLTMQFPEKKLQLANALAILMNTVVIDGQILNARQYIREQDRLARKNGLSYSERTELRKSQEQRIKDLIAEHSIQDKIQITDSEISIPGVPLEEVAKYRTLIIDYNRTLNGIMDENDKMGFRRDTLFSSFMMFKSWIPKLVYVRTGKLEKNLQTGEWDYGRMRGFLKTVLYSDMGKTDIEGEQTKALVTRWAQSIMYSTKRLKDIIYMTDEGIELMNNILYEKKQKHFRETGQELEITEEEFQDVIRDAVINQFKELAVLTAVMGSYFGAVAAEPPEDATPLEINRYKWYFRQINKIGDEITFYYQPGSAESILQGTFIPAIGLISKVERFSSQLAREIYGNITGDQDMVDKSHPTKYFFNLIPIFSQGINEYLPYIDPELAKDLGVRVTKEARR